MKNKTTISVIIGIVLLLATGVQAVSQTIDLTAIYNWTNSQYFATAGGSVGVGTTTPSKTFSVQGSALISGNLTSVANITATGTLTVAGTASSTFSGGIDAARVCLTGTTTCLAPASVSPGGSSPIAFGTTSIPSNAVSYVLGTTTSYAVQSGHIIEVWMFYSESMNASDRKLDIHTSQGTTTIGTKRSTTNNSAPFIGFYQATTTLTGFDLYYTDSSDNILTTASAAAAFVPLFTLMGTIY